MPLEIDRSPGANRAHGTLVIGLINTMPDAALQATEDQFAPLLSAAGLTARWRPGAVVLYRNGLEYLADRAAHLPSRAFRRQALQV